MSSYPAVVVDSGGGIKSRLLDFVGGLSSINPSLGQFMKNVAELKDDKKYIFVIASSNEIPSSIPMLSNYGGKMAVLEATMENLNLIVENDLLPAHHKLALGKELYSASATITK
jgi:hypothetical protein